MRCSDTSIKMKISSLMEEINKGTKPVKTTDNPPNDSLGTLPHRSSYHSPQITVTPNKNLDSSTHLLSKTSKPSSNLAQQMKLAYMKDMASKAKQENNRPSVSPSLARARSERGIIQTKAINKVEKFKNSLEEIQQKISFYSRKNKVQQKFSPEKQQLVNKTSPSPARPFLDQKTQKCKQLCLQLKKKMLKETVSTTTTQILKHEMSIEEFSLGRLLGEGKFSKVYLARHLKTGLILAMKIIKKETIFRQKFQDQLARQIVIQSYFSHVNIVRLYGYFHDQTNVYLLQEYCNAGQLYDIFKVKSKLKEDEWRPIMKGICEGLYALHLNDVIHRDIKPENIMMAFGLPKIGDFGWAVYSPRDRRDTFCGTPLYISPELLMGGSYDKQADIWALGVMMFQFLTGRIPFKIDQQKKLLEIVNSKIEIPQNLSQSCKQLMTMILNKDPESRIAILDVLQHQFLGSTLTGSISQAFFISKR